MRTAIEEPDGRRRLGAAVALLASIAATAALVIGAIRSFPGGLILVAASVASTALALDGLRRRGPLRTAEILVGTTGLLAVVVVAIVARLGGAVIVAIALLALGGVAARRAFAARGRLAAAGRPEHPVMVWNPRSGDGKAARAHLADEAAARGIEAIEIRPGDDLVELVEGAVARGADALAAAGGDGTQALVATIAAREGLPFACIPAGTRNHFALDLGVDRDDVIGALDALVDGGEKVVDLAEVNGRVFVNNASMGIYAAAVQKEGYRNAKVSTVLDTVPDALGGSGDSSSLRWTMPDGTPGSAAAVLLVSNNPYRLGTIVGSGTRPSIDRGVLGVAAVGTRVRRWESPEVVVDADGPVPIGVDGEALVMDPPLRFRIRPGALRVRISRAHPGASPSSDAPTSPASALPALWRIAIGRPGAVRS